MKGNDCEVKGTECNMKNKGNECNIMKGHEGTG
jgi:hypothetical protein